jgi:uncharacterized protein
MKKLAIVGSGVAGLACAFFMHKYYHVTLFEKNPTLGGHTNTLTVNETGQSLAIDTGFMVFNKNTYPNLLRFFEILAIAYQPTDMSFSVNHLPENIQWNGAGLSKLFSQWQNLFRPRFYKLLLTMNRFCKEALEDVDNPRYATTTIANYALAKQYPPDFLTLFLIPISAAIWSTSTEGILGFPVQTLIRFFINHGFLGLDTHFQWYTVTGGSKTYIEALLKQISIEVRVNQGIQSVYDNANGATLKFLNSTYPDETFDKVILASHANQSLAMRQHPTALESDLLSAFEYEKNEAVLHTDRQVMPSILKTWAAWNYRIDTPNTAPEISSPEAISTTHYWMNRLQNLPSSTQYFVSLNASAQVDPYKVIKTIEYQHPTFSLGAIAAQKQLSQINQQHARQSIFFCGSYFKYGFHEDAFTAGLNVCQQLMGDQDLWP